MQVAIIKYNAGNVESVQTALRRIGVESMVTANATEIKMADKVIFPGVGHAYAAMQYLREKKLDEIITSLTQPVLGICLGLQLMCSHSEEGETECLNIFDNKIKLFKSATLKVPQVGWNDITDYRSELFNGISENAYVYYVHSYYASLTEETAATTNYTEPYSAALQKNNFYAVQFHPERSGENGERILRNFLNL